MRSRRWRPRAVAICGITCCLSAVPPCLARSRGIAADGCDGCHGSAVDASVWATVSPAVFGPGDEVIVSLVIAAEGSTSAGLFVTNDAGELRALAGESTALVDAGLTHSQPKLASAGQTTFRFAWRAPDAPGSVRFSVYAVAANDDGRSGGDRSGEGHFDYVFGCTAAEYYFDGDGDGYGRAGRQPVLRCTGDALAGYAPQPGDCDDNRAGTHPTAVELCNLIDDDCDGTTDEDAELIELWPDEDGDGYYRDRTGVSIVGCVPTAGYAAEYGDCSPTIAAVNPGAEEVCNNVDDDCDGRIDDRLRPQCGVGWCRRESSTCSAEHCVPGEPEPEVCNGLDDDCDGEIDEGSLCGAAEACVAGECLPDTTGTGVGASGGAGPAASAVDDESACSSGRGNATSSRAPWLLALGVVLLAARARCRPRALTLRR